MCCTGASQKPSEVMAGIQSRRSTAKIVSMPTPTEAQVQSSTISKEVKQQLLMAQQHARIPQKTG
jgi:hypothetical protein